MTLCTRYIFNACCHRVNVTLSIRKGSNTNHIVNIKSFTLEANTGLEITLGQSKHLFINGIAINWIDVDSGFEQEWSKRLIASRNAMDRLLNDTDGIEITACQSAFLQPMDAVSIQEQSQLQ